MRIDKKIMTFTFLISLVLFNLVVTVYANQLEDCSAIEDPQIHIDCEKGNKQLQEEVNQENSNYNFDLSTHQEGYPQRLKLEGSKKDFVKFGDPSDFDKTYFVSELSQLCEGEAGESWDQVAFSNENYMLNSLKYLKAELVQQQYLKGGSLTRFPDEVFVDSPSEENQTQERTIAQTDERQYNLDSDESFILGRIKSYAKLAFYCTAISSFTGHSEYNGEHSATNTMPGQGGPQQQCAGQPDQQACMQQLAGQMGGFQCHSQGSETQDYLGCKRIEKALTAFYIGQQVHQSTQSIRTQNLAMDEQFKMQQQMQSGEGYQTKDALESQMRGIKQQRGLASERAAFYTAEAATLGGFMASMPTRDKLFSQCEANGKYRKIRDFLRSEILESKVLKFKDQQNRLQSGIESIPGFKEDSVNTLCAEVFSEENYFVLNEQARQMAKQALASAGVKAAAEAAQAIMLGNQMEKIQAAIADWEDPELPEFEEVQFSDALIQQCTINPSMPGCEGVQGVISRGFAPNSISISTGSPNSSAARTELESNGENAAVADVGGELGNGLIPDSIGEVSSSTNNSTEFSDAPPGAGSLKNLGTNAPAGGGAGAAAGGGGGGGGGAGGPRPQGKGAVASAAGRDVKVKFNGGGAGLNFARKRARRPASKPKNPFAKMAKPKNGKGKILNYKNAALGGKSGDIFSMLSNAHKKAIEEERLLRYKTK